MATNSNIRQQRSNSTVIPHPNSNYKTDVTIFSKEKLNAELGNQLNFIRSEYKELYYSYHFNKLKNSSIVESQSTSFIDASNNPSYKAEAAHSNYDIILVNSEKSNSSNKSTLHKAKKIEKKLFSQLVIMWSTKSKKVNCLRSSYPRTTVVRCQNRSLRSKP